LLYVVVTAVIQGTLYLMIRLIASAFPNSDAALSVIMILMVFLFNVGMVFFPQLEIPITPTSDGNQTILANPHMTLVIMIAIGTIFWFIIILIIGEILHKSKEH
jgi:hypothetical protein